jgi:hypothetical protein
MTYNLNKLKHSVAQRASKLKKQLTHLFTACCGLTTRDNNKHHHPPTPLPPHHHQQRPMKSSSNSTASDFLVVSSQQEHPMYAENPFAQAASDPMYPVWRTEIEPGFPPATPNISNSALRARHAYYNQP